MTVVMRMAIICSEIGVPGWLHDEMAGLGGSWRVLRQLFGSSSAALGHFLVGQFSGSSWVVLGQFFGSSWAVLG